jgi:TRAP-type C4-dicarboxylate transport system permease small subunit
VARLSLTGKKICAVLSDLLILACCALIFFGSWKQMIFNMGNASPVSGLPIGLMYVAGVVASIGMFLVIAAHLLRVLTGRATEGELVRVAVSEEQLPDEASSKEQRS